MSEIEYIECKVTKLVGLEGRFSKSGEYVFGRVIVPALYGPDPSDKNKTVIFGFDNNRTFGGVSLALSFSEFNQHFQTEDCIIVDGFEQQVVGDSFIDPQSGLGRAIGAIRMKAIQMHPMPSGRH